MGDLNLKEMFMVFLVIFVAIAFIGVITGSAIIATTENLDVTANDTVTDCLDDIVTLDCSGFDFVSFVSLTNFSNTSMVLPTTNYTFNNVGNSATLCLDGDGSGWNNTQLNSSFVCLTNDSNLSNASIILVVLIPLLIIIIIILGIIGRLKMKKG